MRLRRTLDGRALPGAGFNAFACGLLAMTGIIVGWTKVRQAVVVAWRHVVDGVGARSAAEVADAPVEGVDGGLGAAGGLPVGGEALTAVRTLPTARWHGDPPVWGPWQDLLGREVIVTLSQEPPARQEGVLLAFSDHGEVVLRDDAGEVHWCWPALEMTPKVASKP